MPTVMLVVPCYNEAARLNPAEFLSAVDRYDNLHLLLVDDGSRDKTLEVLQRLAGSRPRISVLALPQNAGKAEAVRRGLAQALATPNDYVGYWDADLATPFDALPDFLNVFAQYPWLEIVVGSRVALLGRRVVRSAVRHYTGRVFGTMTSLVLRMPIYDTQCGAKLFRSTATLRDVVAEPFTSRWIFDVELLARYLDAAPTPGRPPAERIYELVLRQWTDEPGSKVRAKDGVRAAADLLRIYSARRRRSTAGA